MAKERIILHCDLNSFYASVETQLDPSLRDVPMAVCGDPASRHGIILAKNELAKGFDVRTAETIFSAKKKCPELVLVPPHRSAYALYSRRVNEIYVTKTDLVEPFGIDESWLDVTNSAHLFGNGVEIADCLRQEVREQTGLTLSVGVSFNKVFSKLGSDYKKPDATTEISRQNYREIAWRMPVGALLFVGRQAQKVLADMYIKTIGDLAAADPRLIEVRLGKLGAQLWQYANGEDNTPVASYFERTLPKSVGNGMTYRRNLLGMEDIAVALQSLADEVAMRLRAKGLWCQGVSVQIKDPAFKVISRQRTLDLPTNLAREITACAMQLVLENWDAAKPIRALTVTAMHLCDGQFQEQLSLFDKGDMSREKQAALESAVDRLRQKFGFDSLSTGAQLGSDILTEFEEEEE